jgi:hypothetical protein
MHCKLIEIRLRESRCSLCSSRILTYKSCCLYLVAYQIVRVAGWLICTRPDEQSTIGTFPRIPVRIAAQRLSIRLCEAHPVVREAKSAALRSQEDLGGIEEPPLLLTSLADGIRPSHHKSAVLRRRCRRVQSQRHPRAETFRVKRRTHLHVVIEIDVNIPLSRRASF